MQRQAVEVAEEAMSKFQVEKDIAQYIKKEVRRHTSRIPHRNTLGRYWSTETNNKCISSTLAQELHGIALLEGILEASSHTVRFSRIQANDQRADREQKRSTSFTFIWDIARFCFLRLNDSGGWNVTTKKPGYEPDQKLARGVLGTCMRLHGNLNSFTKRRERTT